MTYCDEQDPSRRRFLTWSAVTAVTACLGGLSVRARASDLPHLTTTDPTAKAMDYVEDANTSKNGLYKPGSSCANCQFYAGPEAGYGPCQLFPGKAVNAKGWCTSFTSKKS